MNGITISIGVIIGDGIGSGSVTPTGNRLLMETGDRILLENGDFILLET